MGLKSFNPYTASRRFITVVDKSHITKQQPEKALLEPKKRSGGRNNHGEVVIWHRGGGHKKQYRKVDFRRDKVGVPAKVAAIEYDPNRSANLALLQDRKSTRLNSSHVEISYAVFCLKKKNNRSARSSR